MATPLKVRENNVCICCGNKNVKFFLIQSEAGKKKNLENLLFKYVELRITEGQICRTCESGLLIIDKRVSDLKSKCTENIRRIGTKRGSKPTPVKVHTDKEVDKTPPHKPSRKTPRKSLFSTQTDTTITSSPSPRKSLFSTQTDTTITSSPSKLTVRFSGVSNQPIRTLSSPRKIYNRPAISPTTSPSKIPRPIYKKPHQVTPTPSLKDHVYSSAPILKELKASETSHKISHNAHELLGKDILSLDTKEKYVLHDSVASGDTAKFVDLVLNKTPKLRKAVLCNLVKTHDKHIPSARKHGYVSILNCRKVGRAPYDHLTSFNWSDIVDEMNSLFPSLSLLLLCVMLPEQKREDPEEVERILPRLGMIYSIMIQARVMDLSLVQRMISTILNDSIVDVKVYDRLVQPGICLSFHRSHYLLEVLKGDFDRKMIAAVQNKKTIRLVGDNVNLTVKVRDERQDRHGKMLHYFGSAALIYDLKFPNLEKGKPQRDYKSITASDMLPSFEEINNLVSDYAFLCMKVAARHIHYFAFLKHLMPRHITDQYSQQLLRQTTVVPLAVLARNEQSYGDVVDILRYYETTLHNVYEKAGVTLTNDTKIHIGGDQLTRERFSGAKTLMIGGTTPAQRFDHLSPITFELFHLALKLLSVAFKNSGTDTGTVKAEQVRIQRTYVNPKVKDAYSVDKEFFISYTDAYIVEAICQYFGMDDHQSTPSATKLLPENLTPEEKLHWVQHHFESLVKESVGTFLSKKPTQGPTENQAGATAPAAADSLQVDQPQAGQKFLEVKLPNGKLLRLHLLGSTPAEGTAQKPEPKVDKVQEYAQLSLEFGLLFKNLNDSIKVPNRARMIRTLKMVMVLIKADNNMAKYPDEILRFLVQQLIISSEEDAHLMFYSMFVNTSDRIDTHIPVDLQMEYLVKVYKKHIKKMYSNKSQANIQRKSSSLAAVGDIVENYSRNSGVITRRQKHSTPSADTDEVTMMDDLQELKPFRFTEGRTHEAFKTVNCSVLASLDYNHFFQWIIRRATTHATSLGN